MPSNKRGQNSRSLSRESRRSPSPIRSRNGSRSPDHSGPVDRSLSYRSPVNNRSYSYSDSFDSDTTRQMPIKKNKSTGNVYRRGGGMKSRGGKRGGRKTASIRTASTVSPSHNLDDVTKRVLSARRNKINDLKNEVDELLGKLTTVESENKTLKRDQHIRDKALKKYEHDESNITQIVASHNSEVRSLKEQLKKYRDKYQKTDRHLLDAEDEIEKYKKQVAKLKTLVEEKNLAERDELSRKLTKVEDDLEDTERKVKKLEVHIENLNKNHKHEMGIERHRFKETQRQLQEMTEKYEKLQESLREKEKQLEVQNIYAARLAAKTATHQSTFITHAEKSHADSEPSMTPRDKAKQFEQKRRMDERRQKEERDRREAEINRRREEDERKQRQEQEKLEHDAIEKEEQEHKQREDKERIERIKREKEDAERKRKQEEEDRKKRAKEEDDRKVLAELEKRKKEAAEMFTKKHEPDKNEIHIDTKRHKDDDLRKQQKEREEMQRRAEEERRRLDADEEEQKKRKQKDDLLAKLKAIDESKKMEADLFNLPNDKTVTKSKNKDYSFSDPVEKLHQGKPAHDHVSVPVLNKGRRHRDQGSGEGLFGDDFGGYNPSFKSSPANSPNKKPMSLFDDTPVQSASKTRVSNDSFEDFFTKKDPPTTTKKAEDLKFMFSSNGKVANPPVVTAKQVYSDHQHDLFSEDLNGNETSSLLPRRIKQSAPTFTNHGHAMDDEDIEEVIL